MTAKDLKNALLQEAVQGKLVPQIATEGNARDLLEEIRKEKAKLVKEGKLKKEKPLPEITEEEIPFEIPNNWCWCRLGEIANKITDGTHKTPQYKENGVKFVSAKNICNGKLCFDNCKYISEEEHKELFLRCNPERMDLLLSKSGSIGSVVINEYDFEFSLFESLALIKYNIKLLSSQFLKIAIQYACLFLTEKEIKGVAVKHLPIDSIRNLLIPLPPLAEQKRIVAAIEKFMPLIKEYGKKETELKAFNGQIGTLTKKAILQEAVQGKLVPQIASEGNARDLLEEIRKERLSHGFANFYGICDGKDKKTKKSDLCSKSQISVTKKELPEITEDEIPFDIPENWCWCRLGEVTEIARGGSPRPIKDYLTTDEDGYNWIKIGDTDKDGKYINRTAEKIKKEGLNKTRFVHKGDFLLTNSMSFGRPYILNIDGCIHDGWLVISPKDNIFNKDFLYYVLSSTFAYNQFCDSVSGAVVKNLNSDKVRESLFPLPPLEEQKRIVAAIEKMLPLCEKLGT